jgi:putative tryptophan/tyrosine transport system substrate-binding protein
MKRREFITMLGSAAAWPLAARAQPAAMPVIGFLSSLGPSDLGLVMPGFHQGLNGVGFVEGSQHCDRIPLGAGRLPALAGIVRRSGQPKSRSGRGDQRNPRGVGGEGGHNDDSDRVRDWWRPDRAWTGHQPESPCGVSFYNSPLVTKRLDLARELVPDGSVIAVLVNPDNPPSALEGTAAQAAAAALGQPLLILNASTQGHIEDAFATIKQQQVRALIVSSDPFFFSQRVKLVVLMARDGVPTIFADREQAEAGGLISYGASRSDAYRQAGYYVGRIVKGEKPAELPVILPTKFHIVVNLKTAKSLRIDVPATILARADEVIE